MTSLFTPKGKATCRFLRSPMSSSSCCLFPCPPTLLSVGQHGWGGDSSCWAEPALHHLTGQLRPSGLPRLYSRATGQVIPGPRGSHQVTKTAKTCRKATRNAHGSLSHDRYETSMRALQDLVLAMQAGQWAEAMDLYSAARSVWQELRKSHDLRWQVFSYKDAE